MSSTSNGSVRALPSPGRRGGWTVTVRPWSIGLAAKTEDVPVSSMTPVQVVSPEKTIFILPKIKSQFIPYTYVISACNILYSIQGKVANVFFLNLTYVQFAMDYPGINLAYLLKEYL